MTAFVDLRKYFLRPEKNGALDFKNEWLKRYFINLDKTNGLKINNSFVIIQNLFDTNMWFGLREINVFKSVNK